MSQPRLSLVCFSLIIVVVMTVFATQSLAQKTSLERFQKPMDPIEKVVDLIKRSKMEEADKFLAGIGLATGGQVASVLKTWVGKGTINKIDLLKEERLGSVLRRYFYVMQREAGAYMFIVFYVMQAKDGWILYNFNFNTNMQTFFPSWTGPSGVE